MAKQKVKLIPGDVINHKGDDFEVLHVSGQGEGDSMHSFVYEICLQSEAEERRQKDAESAEEQRKLADEERKKAEAEQPVLRDDQVI